MQNRAVSAAVLTGVLLVALSATALATDVLYYEGDIWGGKTIDVGNIYAILHYDNQDTTLEIKYVTEDGWLLKECHLEPLATQPTERGEPGHYRYKQEDINSQEFSFYIPIDELHSLFSDGVWGHEVYFLPHAGVWLDADNDGEKDPDEQEETGYGGEVVEGRPWYGYFAILLVQPTPGQEPIPFEGVTYTRGYWQRYWWTPTPKKPTPPRIWTDEFRTKALPVTLAGVQFSTPNDFYDWLKTPVTGEMFIQFVAQLIALHCNLKLTEDLGSAIYDNLNLTGEPMEGMTVQMIYDSANTYRQNTPAALLLEMKDVMDAINNNYEATQKVLWQGQMSSVVGQGGWVRLILSPNPFTSSVRIRLQNGSRADFRVSVYDRSGNKVNELTLSGGELTWNGTDFRGRLLAAGVYLLKVRDRTGSGARVIITR
ncbi:MAG: T9SS type A sorting domain-containing protein [candidate division WOR-3 bacterium]